MKVKLSTITPQQRREMQEWEKQVRKECLQEAEKYTMDLIKNNFFTLYLLTKSPKHDIIIPLI